MKIELYKKVMLKRDLVYGTDFIGNSKQTYKKGSKGYICDEIDDAACFVEFSHGEYTNPVVGVKYIDLEEIK